MQQEFLLNAKLKSAVFSLREDHTLAVTAGGRTLVFHDFIRKGSKRFYFFGQKATMQADENCVTVRTAATEEEDGAPIPGLLVTYRFTFEPVYAAFYVSVSYGSDVRTSGYTLRLMDVTWEGLDVQTFTGYEWDANGDPFCHTFTVPTEKNPIAPDYETLMRIRPHVAWERMKTRPVTFKRAVAVEGTQGWFAVCGGTPTYHIEAEFIQTYSEIASFEGDLRWLSGQNSPGAWFILEKPADLVPVLDQLEARRPETPTHILVPFPEEILSLQAGTLQSRLLKTKGGMWVCPFGANTDDTVWPLFFLDLWDTQLERTIQLDSGYGWDRVEVTQRTNYLRLTLSDPEFGKIRGITVVAEAVMEPGCNRISWTTTLVNRSDRWSATKISYPQCVTQGYDTAFAPMGSGMCMDHFNQRSCTFRGKYPTGVKVNMAYTAVYNPKTVIDTNCNGVYIGIHDPDGTPKFLNMTGAPQSHCILHSTECTPDWQRHPGNSFTLPGKMVWQSFSGDWFDATEIYREFVHRQATWLSPLRGRCDSPQWLRQNPIWIMHFMPNENPDANPFPVTLREKYADKDPADWYRTAVKFRKQIGVPVTYHLYNWHWVPFNNDNPHYFPTHHDLKAGIRELKAADIRIVPYIAAYSWDMCDNRGGNDRFEQEALPATAKNVGGDPIYTSYASTEPTGQPVRFARMCPTTTVWKNEVRQICRQLDQEFQMDGIYLDVVSTAYEQCCDENHLHIPGHGSFWWKAYRELIAGLREGTSPDFAMVSESTSEVYSGCLDGYLSWTWVQPDSVPAHSRIYGGHTAIFGRVITSNKRDDAAYFRFQVAQSLVYGQQLGWIHPEIVDDPVQFPFLKKMANLRWEDREFFAEAEMLRPPVLQGELPLLDCEGFLRSQLWNHEKAVVAGGWEDAQGQRKLYVVNSSDQSTEFTLCVSENEYALPAELSAPQVSDGFTLVSAESRNGMRYLHCRMAPEGYGIFNW